MLESLTPDDPDPDEFPRTSCGCGMELIFTPDGWQHDCAPWFWGDDHEADVSPEAQAEALRYIVDHCPHRRADDMPEPGDRCKDCGIAIVWVGPGQHDWEPAVGAIPWREEAEEEPPPRGSPESDADQDRAVREMLAARGLRAEGFDLVPLDPEED